MAYTFDEPRIGLLQIANTDPGITPPNGSTVIPTPPNVPGMVVRAKDPTYGEGEFILLKGKPSTIVGSVVIYDGTTYQTTLAPQTNANARPVAFSMAANVSSAVWSWYQFSGTVVAAKGIARIQPTVAVGVSSTGLIGNTATAIELESVRSANAATVLTAATTITLTVDRPHYQGRVSL